MRAISTTAILPAPGQPMRRTAAVPANRSLNLFGRLFRRQKPTLFQRCLAVHMAAAGKMSELR